MCADENQRPAFSKHLTVTWFIGICGISIQGTIFVSIMSSSTC